MDVGPYLVKHIYAVTVSYTVNAHNPHWLFCTGTAEVKTGYFRKTMTLNKVHPG